MFTKGSYKQPTGYMKSQFSKRLRVPLSTNLPFGEEAYAALAYLSEVDKVGIELLRTRSTPQPKKTHQLFKSFIRQSKTFYDAAQQLHYRASALMYYYAFLNLSKALVAMRDPAMVEGKIHHGLSLGTFKQSVLSRQSVTVQTNGVFQELFLTERGTRVPSGTKLNIMRLLSYCSDIAHEYQTAGHGNSKILKVYARIFTQMSEKLVWPVVAVANFDQLTYFKSSTRPISNYFELAEWDKPIAKEAFGLSGHEMTAYTFLQAKKNDSFY